MSRLRRLLQPVNWTYAVGEVSLIVIGVLIALAANAWWVERGDAARERAYRLQLIADLRASEASLGRSIRRLRDAERSATAALDAFRAPAPPDSLGQWIRGTIRRAPPDLVLGTARSLVASGDAHLLFDEPLRSAVIRLVDRLDRLESSQEEFSRSHIDYAHMLMLRVDQVDLGQYPPVPDSAAALVSSAGTPAARRRPFPVDYRALLRDQSIYGTLFVLRLVHSNLRGQQERMLEEIRAVREMAEAGGR
jgi:hypothetical protein